MARRYQQLHQLGVVTRRRAVYGAGEVGAIVLLGSNDSAVVLLGQAHVQSTEAMVLFVEDRSVSGHKIWPSAERI